MQRRDKIQKKKPKFQITFLTEDMLDQATEIIAKGFLKFNIIWIKLGINYQQSYYLNRYRVIFACRTHLSFKYYNVDNGQAASILLGFDLYDYFNTKQFAPIVPQWMKYIKKWGSILQAQIHQKYRDIKRGQYIYGDCGGTNDKYAGTGISFKFYKLTMLYYREIGYKGYFTRTTHVATRKMIVKMGGKVLNKLQFNDPEKPQLNGECMQLVLVKFDDLKFQSLNQIYDEAEQIDQFD